MTATVWGQAPASDTDGARCRDQVRQLVLNGWPLVALASRIGYTTTLVSTVAHGRRRASNALAEDVDGLWQLLHETEGPSTASANYAHRLGWHRPAPPLPEVPHHRHEPAPAPSENDYLDAQIYRCDTCGNWRMSDVLMRAPHTCSPAEAVAA